jgi:secreted trypsin-like serine protease
VKAFLALIALTTAALAGTTDERIPDSVYVEYATAFAPYARRLAVTGTDARVSYATAAVIGDRWALTAGHVVHDADCAVIDKKHEVIEIVVHPDFDAGKLGWNDIALLRVAEPFGLDYYPPLATEQDAAPGDTVTLAGYGLHGRLGTGYTNSDGRLRAGTNVVERHERSIIVCSAGGGGSPLEFCISPGDSGGPMFSAGRDGRLVGIASFTMADKGPLRSRRGEEMGHTRVSLFREWIRKVVGE